MLADPGTGKTAIFLHAFALLKREQHAKRMLVLVKARTLYTTWPNEIDKWGLPLKYVILHGAEKDELLESEFDVAVMNYEGLPWLLSRKKLASKLFDVLACDESSMLKDTRTQRYKTLKYMLDWFSRRYVMTGTPASESLLNLFGQVYVLDQGETFTPYITHFRISYFMPTGYMGYDWVLRPGADKEIFEAVAPLMLRIPRDVLPLPPLAIVDRRVELPKHAQDLYRKVEEDFITQWQGGLIKAANAAVATQKLRQIANGSVYDDTHAVQFVHEEKVGEMVDLIDELEGKSVFILYEFEHDLAALKKAFPKLVSVADTKASKMDELVADFNGGKIRLLAGQTQSVAHGLNLQADAHNVIFYSLPWSLENYIQAIARVWRQGQKNAVTVYRLIAAGTVDEDVSVALETKDATQRALLDAMERRYGEPR